jgi:tetratricopeptide (TPR) repeat protein
MHSSKAIKLLIAVSVSTITLFVGALALAQTPVVEDYWLDQADKGEIDVDDIPSLQRAAQEHPDVYTYLDLGWALEEYERFEEAEAAYQTALRLDPNCLDIYLDLGFLLEEQGQLDEAIALYKKAILLDSEDGYTYVDIGDILYELEQYEFAEAAYRKAIQSEPEFSDYYYLLLGDALNAQNKFQAAEAAYRESIRLFPPNSEFSDYMGSFVYTQLGNVLASQDKSAEAAEMYQTASRLALEEESAAAIDAPRGFAFSDSSTTEEPFTGYLSTATIVIDVEDGAFNPYYSLGTALYRQGEMPAAEAAYREAVQRYPEEAIALYALGNVLVEQHKADEAIAFYREAVRLNSQNDLIYQSLGQALSDQGRSEQAEIFYRQTVLPLITDPSTFTHSTKQ